MSFFEKTISFFLRSEFKNLPLIPLPKFEEIQDTLNKLLDRTNQTIPAIEGLNNKYTLNGKTATGTEFLFGSSHPELGFKGLLEITETKFYEKLLSLFMNKDEHEKLSESLTGQSLESPEQWSISWTNYADVYSRSKKYLDKFASTLENRQSANSEFWPTIAKYGLGYNLLILQKVKQDKLSEIQSIFQNALDEDLKKLSNDGLLYFIDMRIFDAVPPTNVDGFDRFTPTTVTLLQQDSVTKKLTPIAVQVSKPKAESFVYTQSSKSWLYALQAVKTSITVYGIWLGHVYHWHIVTAAMIDTMNHKIDDPNHLIQQMVSPQSKYLIPFDLLLLSLWYTAAPPTSISTPWHYLKLIDKFAESRTFFDEDIDKKIRMRQAKMIIQKQTSYSYSKVLNEALRKVLK